ncbi:MAG: hypothetical protein JW828_05050 [Sedimentisphaerales bacterium]|nr:hypothetical protein [Sedimentisphaerales bacterium]
MTTNEAKKTEYYVRSYLANLPVPDAASVDEKVLADALRTMQTKRQQTALPGALSWRMIMTSKTSKLAAAVIVVAALFFVFNSSRFGSSAWALEDAIDALRDYGAAYIVGAFPGGTAEIWMRADKTRSQSMDVLVKGSHGAITWTQDGSTYHYEPEQNTVYYEEALTVGFSQWLGPPLLEMLGSAENAELIRGKDPATGRDRVTLLCSMIDVNGAQSWNIEFDVESKLPIAFKQWPNLDRHGPPGFEAYKVVYYENLPDSFFVAHISDGVQYVEKPLMIPEEALGILSNPQDGISTDGMTQQEAAEKVLRAMFQAVIEQDLDRLKKMCPLCRNWGNEFLRKIILKPGKEDRIVEILQIGQITKTGHTKLGPIVAIPITVLRQNGAKAEQQMIVQFRQIGSESSCVVHGPRGLPHKIE